MTLRMASRDIPSHLRPYFRSTATPTKSLLGIPWRYALRCIDDLGLILRAEVIWSKPNGLPESVTDRVRRSHEQWFHFSLNPRYYSAVDEIRESYSDRVLDRQQYAGRADVPLSKDRGDRHDGNPARGILGHGHRGLSPLGKLPGSVWTIPTEPLTVPDHLGVDHFAAFPTEFPKRIIAGWSPAGVCTACGEGRRPVSTRGAEPVKVWDLAPTGTDRLAGHRHGVDGSTLGVAYDRFVTGYACACLTACDFSVEFGTHAYMGREDGLDDRATCCNKDDLPPTRPAVILDVFGGTGTTAMVAKALGRHGITVDMSSDYCRLAKWRVNDRAQLGRVLGFAKAEVQPPDQLGLFDLDGAAS